MSAVIHQFRALRREPEASYVADFVDPPVRTAQAIYNCLKSLLSEAEGQGLSASAAALRLAIDVVAVDLRP